MHLQSPLLRLLVQFYGSFGLQFVPVSYIMHNRFFMLQTVWNLLLIALFYTTLLKQLFSHDHVGRDQMHLLQHQKPLMELFHELTHHLFTITTALNIGYFLFMSFFCKVTVLHLLDSFSNCFAKRTTAFTSSPYFNFFAILTFNFAFFMGIFPEIPNTLLESNYNFFTKMVKLFSLFLGYFLFHFHTVFIVVCINQYVKMSIFFELRELHRNVPQMSLKQIGSQLRLLSEKNDQFNWIMSFPLSLAIINYTFSFILTLSTFLYGVQINSWFYALAFLVDFLSLTTLDRMIMAELCKLERRLKRRSQVCTLKLNLIYTIEMLSVYRHCFTTRLFNVCTVDNVFWFSAILFIAGKVVLVTQTNV